VDWAPLEKGSNWSFRQSLEILENVIKIRNSRSLPWTPELQRLFRRLNSGRNSAAHGDIKNVDELKEFLAAGRILFEKVPGTSIMIKFTSFINMLSEGGPRRRVKRLELIRCELSKYLR
jgi:hypothetical protein